MILSKGSVTCKPSKVASVIFYLGGIILGLSEATDWKMWFQS